MKSLNKESSKLNIINYGVLSNGIFPGIDVVGQ